MKNKIRERLFTGLFLTAVFVFFAFLVQGKATDAFVVEESAVIGAPEPEEPAVPVFVQPPVPEQQPEQPGEPAKENIEKQPQQEPVKEPETVSCNTVQPAFQVPVRRKDTTEPEIPFEKPEPEELEPEPPGAEEVMSKETEKNYTWILLAVSGIFLLGGIIRILQRLRIRYGKL